MSYFVIWVIRCDCFLIPSFDFCQKAIFPVVHVKLNGQ